MPREVPCGILLPFVTPDWFRGLPCSERPGWRLYGFAKPRSGPRNKSGVTAGRKRGLR